MKYLHTMVRVANIEDSLDFYCNKLGLTEINRYESEEGRFTLVFLAAPAMKKPKLNSPTTGIQKTTKKDEILVTLPTQLRIFMKLAST